MTEEGKVRLTPDELRSQAREWAELFVDAAKAYDRGSHVHAANLARSIRILLEDKKCLLKLLGHDPSALAFFDTPESGRPVRLMVDHARAFIPVGGTPITDVGYTAVYDPPENNWSRIPFERWWNQDKAIDIPGVRLTRRRIVREMANRDKGTHIDGAVGEEYARLKRQEVMGLSLHLGSVSARPAHGRERPAVRQIAYEVQKTIAAELSSVFTGEVWYPPPVYSFPREMGGGQPSLGSTLIIRRDTADLVKKLEHFEKSGEGECLDARLFRSQIYWNGTKEGG